MPVNPVLDVVAVAVGVGDVVGVGLGERVAVAVGEGEAVVVADAVGEGDAVGVGEAVFVATPVPGQVCESRIPESDPLICATEPA